MNQYKLYSGKGHVLGTIACDSISEAELFLAMNFPDDYFGANIVGDKAKIIAIREAFDDESITPVQIVLQHLDSSMKIKNGLYTEEHYREGVLKKPYTHLISVNGEFIEGLT